MGWCNLPYGNLGCCRQLLPGPPGKAAGEQQWGWTGQWQVGLCYVLQHVAKNSDNLKVRLIT